MLSTPTSDRLAIGAEVAGVDLDTLLDSHQARFGRFPSPCVDHAPSASFGGGVLSRVLRQGGRVDGALAKNHPLLDGNKRAAWTLRMFILRRRVDADHLAPGAHVERQRGGPGSRGFAATGCCGRESHRRCGTEGRNWRRRRSDPARESRSRPTRRAVVDRAPGRRTRCYSPTITTFIADLLRRHSATSRTRAEVIRSPPNWLTLGSVPNWR